MGKFKIDPDCIKQREYVNIPAWHKAGYIGEGLTVFCDDVGGSHTDIVKDIIQTILPKAKVLSGNIFSSVKSGKVAECGIYCFETRETMPFDDFIKKYDVSMINNSTDGGNGTEIMPIAEYMKEKIKEYNLIFTGAAGNAADRPTQQKYYGACIMVAAVRFENGKAVYSNHSIGENIDFSMFQGFGSGTSFASPFLLGMAGLLRGRHSGITQEEIKQYFIDHSEDIGLSGKDLKSGWGVPIMGNPETIIKMWPGKNFMTVDGNEVKLDQAPEIKPLTGRALVPVRAISEALGVKVDWDAIKKEITIVR